jgi:hypothetical protein
MKEMKTKSDVILEVNKSGFEQIRVYPDSSSQHERALPLLIQSQRATAGIRKGFASRIET